MRNRTPVPSFPAERLVEFVNLELEGDLTRLTKSQRARYENMRKQKRVFFYSADEFLLSIDSHLRFFEDWLSEQHNEP